MIILNYYLNTTCQVGHWTLGNADTHFGHSDLLLLKFPARSKTSVISTSPKPQWGLFEPLYHRRYRGFSSQFPQLDQMALYLSTLSFYFTGIFTSLEGEQGHWGNQLCERKAGGRAKPLSPTWLLPGLLTPVVGPQKGHQPVVRRIVECHLSILGQKGVGVLGPSPNEGPPLFSRVPKPSMQKPPGILAHLLAIGNRFLLIRHKSTVQLSEI